MKLRKKFILLELIITVIILCLLWKPQKCMAASRNQNDNGIYTVLVTTNVRTIPSTNGGLVTTVPDGALVYHTGQCTSGFAYVQYGDYTGYVFEGSISKVEKDWDDYAAQFEEVDDIRYTNREPSIESETIKTDSIRDSRTIDFIDELNASRKEEKELLEDSENEKNTIHNEETETVSDNSASKNAAQAGTVSENVNGSLGEDKGGADIIKKESTLNEDIDETVETSIQNSGLAMLVNNKNSALAISQSNTETREKVYATTLANVKIRQKATTESTHLTSVKEGEQVLVLDEGENGFTHIRYEGTTGYIYSRCLDYDLDLVANLSYLNEEQEKNASKQKQESAETVNSTFVPSPLGEQRITDASSSYMAMASKNEGSLSDMMESQISSAETAMEEIDDVQLDLAKTVDARTKMRSLPSSGSNMLITLPVGADIIYMGNSRNGYALVQYDGMTGYILENYIVDSVDITKLGGEPVMFYLTGYCSCRICCGDYSPEVTGRTAHTSTGTIPEEGRTIAVDPSVVPYGTEVYIEGLGRYKAEDCGGLIEGNHIDIYFEKHEDAKNFGTQRRYVTIVN